MPCSFFPWCLFLFSANGFLSVSESVVCVHDAAFPICFSRLQRTCLFSVLNNDYHIYRVRFLWIAFWSSVHRAWRTREMKDGREQRGRRGVLWRAVWCFLAFLGPVQKGSGWGGGWNLEDLFTKFHVYHTVLLAIITRLYIRSPELINLITESL